MLDGVGNDDVAAIQPCIQDGAIQHLAGGPHERVAGSVFLVTGLLAYHHHARRSAAFAGDALRGIAPERTAAAGVDRLCQGLQPAGGHTKA
jgi:hypothetical protein